MNIAAIYCRLSKEDEDKLRIGDESESIQNQKMLLINYALEHNMQIYQIYCDEDYSGADQDRPSWNKMLKEAQDGNFNVILCKTQSRFTREMEIVEKYIHGLFLEWGIRFIGVVDHVDTEMKGNKKARQISGLVNEWYLEDLSENIKSVLRKKMEEGQFLGAFAPYGYRKDPEDRHKIIVEDETAKIVKLIYQWYLEGYSIKSICHMLTEARIPTPTAYKQKLGYRYKNPNANSITAQLGIWGATTVRSILRNNTYIGVLTQGKEIKVSYKSKKVVKAPKNQWVVIENHHEAIIDKDTFYKVQELLQSRRTVSGRESNGSIIEECHNLSSKGSLQDISKENIKKNSKENITKNLKENLKENPKENENIKFQKRKAHPLAGKMKCLDCGSSLIRTGGSKSPKSRYLRCQLASKTKNTKCTPHSIRLDRLIHIVSEEIRGLFHSVLLEYEKEVYHQVKAIVSENNLLESKIKEESKEQRILKENQDALSSLYLDKVNKIISQEEFLFLKEKISHTIKEKEIQIQKMQKEIEELKHMNKREVGSLIQQVTEFEDLTSEMVFYLIDYIEVGEKDQEGNQVIHIYWNL